MLIWIFSIGIKILFVFSQLVSMPLFTFIWYEFLNVFMFSFNWYQNVPHWHILIGILIDCHPLVNFCFEQKGEEHFLLFLTPFWCMTKRGRSIIWVWFWLLQSVYVFMNSCIWVLQVSLQISLYGFVFSSVCFMSHDF